MRRRVVVFLLVCALYALALTAPPLEANVGITVPILIQGHVTLQRPNAPPPDPSWSVPLTITLSLPGATTPVYTWRTQTDEQGDFDLVDTFTPGTYDVRVKNVHTLRNLKRNVLLTGGANTLDLGTLREGDANGDNRVNVADFTLLRNAYFSEEGQANFDPRTDFDEDNRINVRDFALLRGNYFAEGDVVIPRRPTQGGQRPVTVWAMPQRVRADLHTPTRVLIRLDTGDWAAVGADVVVTFDAPTLQVVTATGTPTDTVTPGDAFDTVLANRVDNTNGRITFGAGTFGTPVQGAHTLFSFYLLATQPTPDSPLLLSQVDVVDATGRSLPLVAYPAHVRAGSFTDAYLARVLFAFPTVPAGVGTERSQEPCGPTSSGLC